MNSPYDTYKTEELKRKLKSQQKSGAIHLVVVILLFITGAYKTYKEGISFYSFLPLFFVPMQVYISVETKKLKKALKNRK